MTNKNTYRVFAFSEDVIDTYKQNDKVPELDLTNYPKFDTILIFIYEQSELVVSMLEKGNIVANASFRSNKYPCFHFPIELAGTIKPEQKEEPLFREGDRVFDWAYQWCVITQITTHGTVYFIGENESEPEKKHSFFGEHLKRLSFTEYNFVTGGWSQERPKPLPKVGDIGWFWDDKMDIVRKCCSYGELSNIIEGVSKYVLNGARYRYFSTKNPFEK